MTGEGLTKKNVGEKYVFVCLPCEMGREKEWLNGLTACQMDCDQLAVSQSCASSIWTNTFRNLDKYILEFGQIQFKIWTNTVYELYKYFYIMWKVKNFQKITHRKGIELKSQKETMHIALWNLRRMMKVFWSLRRMMKVCWRQIFDQVVGYITLLLDGTCSWWRQTWKTWKILWFENTEILLFENMEILLFENMENTFGFPAIADSHKSKPTISPMSIKKKILFRFSQNFGQNQPTHGRQC